MKEYVIDGFKLKLNDNHMLAEYQRQFPMYDRFVPYLGKIADMFNNGGESLILDIGANVGDTVAAFIKHTKAHAVCVEPTDLFFDLCKENVQNFGGAYKKRITLVKAYISSDMNVNFTSEISQGTAKKVENNHTGGGMTPTYSIPYLMEKIGKPMECLNVVKVDTDGYDADCIVSFGENLSRLSPVLYWENQLETPEQTQKYLNLADYLYSSGYRAFYVFDNFGNYLLRTDADGLKDFNLYLWRMLRGASGRTFYYTDVLATKPDRLSMADIAVKEYISKYT
ncbi:MAG: FkbM family methyltransferase [Selenomonadaceae bacterium]|nr:FkbM family methyltransferase [Selenomonadaceae bacterium]MBR3723443.1 FkbM family methyltransferase [Selenomonadaceae bacterium]